MDPGAGKKERGSRSMGQAKGHGDGFHSCSMSDDFANRLHSDDEVRSSHLKRPNPEERGMQRNAEGGYEIVDMGLY